MSKKREVQSEQFDAVSDEGRRFRLRILTTMIDASSMSNPDAAPIEGMKSVRTSDGMHCNWIDDDTFEIVELGLQVKRE